MASSRGWVCVRAATYEDPLEAAFLSQAYNEGLHGLETIFHVRPGRLENTTFGLFGPDARPLTCVERDPIGVLDTARVTGLSGGGSGAPTRRLARMFDRLASRFEPTAELSALPLNLDLRRALNVAACDNQPLVLIVPEAEASGRRVTARLAALAWSERFVGRLQYVIATPQELALTDVEGLPGMPFVAVLETGTFGVSGRVLVALEGEPSASELRQLLDQGLARYGRGVLDRAAHVREGLRAGIEWQSVVPRGSSATFREVRGEADPHVEVER